MSYNREIASLLRTAIITSGWNNIKEEEKNDGLSFSINREPLARIEGDRVLVRCFPEDTDLHLEHPGVRQLSLPDNTFVGGWLMLEPEVAHSNLAKWLQVSYNHVSTLV